MLEQIELSHRDDHPWGHAKANMGSQSSRNGLQGLYQPPVSTPESDTRWFAPAVRTACERRRPAADACPKLAPMQNELLAWYSRHKRDLPWRRTRDPYAIFVSEVMLQQTHLGNEDLP